MKEITLSNGQKPVNPLGECFDSAAHTLLDCHFNHGIKAVMCHGIGVSNLPGEEPEPIAHAWLEFEHGGQTMALDTTFMIAQPADIYRQNLKLGMVIQYNLQEFIEFWSRNGYPGPYVDSIKALTKEGKAANA